METVKVRRVGNSNVMTLPRGCEELGFTEGASVAITQMPSGALLIIPAAQLDDYIRALSQQVVADNREAFERLAKYDQAPEGSGPSAEQAPR